MLRNKIIRYLSPLAERYGSVTCHAINVIDRKKPMILAIYVGNGKVDVETRKSIIRRNRFNVDFSQQAQSSTLKCKVKAVSDFEILKGLWDFSCHFHQEMVWECQRDGSPTPLNHSVIYCGTENSVCKPEWNTSDCHTHPSEYYVPELVIPSRADFKIMKDRSFILTPLGIVAYDRCLDDDVPRFDTSSDVDEMIEKLNDLGLYVKVIFTWIQ